METINPVPSKPAITLDLLNQIDVRVGTIERIEEDAASTKLVKLTVDFGDHKRCIIAGIKKERPESKRHRRHASVVR